MFSYTATIHMYYFNSLATNGFLIGFQHFHRNFLVYYTLVLDVGRYRICDLVIAWDELVVCVDIRDSDRYSYRRMLSENAWFYWIPNRERILRGLAAGLAGLRRKTVIFHVSLFFKHLATKDFGAGNLEISGNLVLCN